jgi:5S rRNA maturation endonuclease (ribonuclease M5)
VIPERDMLARFERVERQREGDWLVACPSHDDGRPSLHITLEPERWLVHCLAGCSFEAVCGAARLTPADLAAQNGNGRREVELYDYTDEAGVLLFQVVRLEPKGFRQRRPDGNGGWIYKLGNTRRVPYRLPSVIEAIRAGRTIWIVEGEKDVHALEATGEVATCNPAGAGKWRPEYSEALQGATVRIVADRDDAGRKHAQEVALALMGHAAHAEIVKAAAGKDVCDHLAAGHGLDQLKPVGAASPKSAIEAPPTSELLDAIGKFVRRFVILPSPAAYRTVALYALHTWAFPAAHATPYLVIESPEKQAGKTRLLEVLDLVCRNPVKAASISAAGLYQTIGSDAPTLLIDEADAIFGGNSERHEDLRGVLNAGNLPGTSVIRGGKDGKPVRFNVYCPKVIAGIATGRLPDTIRDRAIVIPIDRKLRTERVERLRVRRLQAELDELRARLAAWAAQHHDRLSEYDLPEPLEEISDRLEEAWEPLLAIADHAGGDWPQRAREAANGLAAADSDTDEGTASLRVLLELRDVFGDEEAMATKNILEQLNLDEDAGFGSWNDGNGVNPRTLGRLLKRYRVHPRTIRLPDGKTVKGYKREWFQDAWSRYLQPLAVTSVTTAPQSQIGGFRSVTSSRCDG